MCHYFGGSVVCMYNRLGKVACHCRSVWGVLVFFFLSHTHTHKQTVDNRRHCRFRHTYTAIHVQYSPVVVRVYVCLLVPRLLRFNPLPHHPPLVLS